MSARDHEDLIGKQIGHYAIHRRLGKGGMGSVYLAQDLTLDRPVAIKVLLPITAVPTLVEQQQLVTKVVVFIFGVVA